MSIIVYQRRMWFYYYIHKYGENNGNNLFVVQETGYTCGHAWLLGNLIRFRYSEITLTYIVHFRLQASNELVALLLRIYSFFLKKKITTKKTEEEKIWFK